MMTHPVAGNRPVPFLEVPSQEEACLEGKGAHLGASQAGRRLEAT